MSIILNTKINNLQQNLSNEVQTNEVLLRRLNAPPADVSSKLYEVNGILFWDGNLLSTSTTSSVISVNFQTADQNGNVSLNSFTNLSVFGTTTAENINVSGTLLTNSITNVSTINGASYPPPSPANPTTFSNLNLTGTTTAENINMTGTLSTNTITNVSTINGVPVDEPNKELTTWTTQITTDNNWKGICWSETLNLFCAVSNNFVMLSSNGKNWTNYATPVNRDWSSVVWSPQLNLFCAVANSSPSNGQNVMTSPNGINWTLRTNAPNFISGFGNVPFYFGYNNIVWSSELNLFVACVSSNTSGAPNNVYTRVSTSPNGINWTIRDLFPQPLNDVFFNDVVWSPELNLFVAVGGSGNNRVMTSPNGVNWTARNVPLANWKGLSWSPELGLFCAVGTNEVMTSSNGINWTMRTTTSNDWSSVSWSSQLNAFVACSLNNGKIQYSFDGINWVNVDVANNEWSSITWSPLLEQFCCVSTSGSNNRALLSFSNRNVLSVNNLPPDQNGNVSLTTFSNLSLTGNTTSNNMSITGTLSVNNITNLSTLNGVPVSETERLINFAIYKTSPFYWETFQRESGLLNLSTIEYSPQLGIYVVGAVNGTTQNNIATNSTIDSEGWINRTTPEAQAIRKIVWNGSFFVGICSSGNNRAIKSNDGITWTGHSTSENNTWFGLAYSKTNNIFVACSGDGNNRIITSQDGETWTTRSVPLQTWRRVNWIEELNEFWCASLDGVNRAMKSSDGINWQLMPLPAFGDSTWNTIVYGKNVLVAVANNTNNHIAYSFDFGMTWFPSTFSGSSSVSLVSVDYSPSGQVFVATANSGASNRYIFSYNGISWFEPPQPVNLAGTATMWFEDTKKFVSVGSNSFICSTVSFLQ